MALFQPDIQPYLRNWFTYNPAVEIGNLNVPVLVVQGRNDLQVTVDDAELLKKGKANAQLLLLDSMNHILKNAPSDLQGNFTTNNQPDLPVSPKLLESMIEFIRKNKVARSLHFRIETIMPWQIIVGALLLFYAFDFQSFDTL
jgi:uncharacterized protein